MIGHFFKWLELVSLPNYNIKGATYVILDKMFNRFGASTKILTNQGMEFSGEFQ
jgi:hypothetical protein